MIRADLGKRDPQKPGRKCRPGEDESRCVFGWERLQRDAAAGHSQASFHVAAGVRSSAGGRGWAGCLAPSLGWGAGLRDPARPVRPQWEAWCPPPLRRCCPSALPARPLHSAPLGPTCEERFVLEQASHHPQQPVLHVLAASLLTLLIPRPGQRNSIRDPCPWLRTHGIPCEPSHTRPSHVFWPGRAISKTRVPSSRKSSQISSAPL